jgi:two-component system, response regulator YesN
VRVLIVDDEPIIRRGLVSMMNRVKFSLTDIRMASNGVKALQVLEDYEADIVFTDIRMPQMNGLELCQYISEHYRHILMVVISGYEDFTYAQKCLSYGVKHYLLKPITTVDMNKILDDLTKQREQEVISLSHYIEWVECAEQMVWNQDRGELELLISYWLSQSTSLHVTQLRSLINDCLKLLIEKLRTKGFEPFAVPKSIPDNISYSKHDIIQHVSYVLQYLLDEATKKRTGIYKDPLEEVKDYIDSHLAEDITLEEIADLAGFSPAYFSTIFKKSNNETFMQYRINKRMHKAKELLAIPHLRIMDIASTVGYEDYPNFNKIFKKTTGYSPSEYRQMLGIK